ncbi:MAG: tyrosine-type recombinase/integrase, partial [Leeuwenhoekiella sp.]
MNTITLEKLLHNSEVAIALRFDNNYTVRAKIKTIEYVAYSNTHRCYYILERYTTRQKLYQHLRNLNFYVDYSAYNATKIRRPAIPKIQRQTLSKDMVDHVNIPILKKYVTYLRGKRFSDSTVRTYYGFVLSFAIYMKEKPLSEAKLDDLSLFLKGCIQTYKYSISTHRQMISAFKHLIIFTPNLNVEDLALQQPKKSKNLPQVLSAEEVLDLLRSTRNLKHRAVLGLIYSCGLRIGELQNLELRDLDLDRNQLHVRQGKGRKD